MFGFGVAVLWLCASASAQEKWTVHEWGTFTSLQDEAGQTIGGINTDDEPVPTFVHELAGLALLRPTEIPAFFFQGAPSCQPDVTMRLETPVLYFHRPAAVAGIATTDVRVKFRGGWLTEFFPAADPSAPGLKAGMFQFPRFDGSTESSLAWNKLKLGGHWPLTNTSAHVWTSPRAVDAVSVQTTNGESERFLFYRGVAHINAPLKVTRNRFELEFRSQLGDLPTDKPLTIRSIWLVDIRSRDLVAFRPLPALTLDRDPDHVLTHTFAAFAEQEFRTRNLEKLKAALRKALVDEGLFPDEAEALLNTWQLSYFQSPGLRVFFIVPRLWTDFYLPLETSLPADINRVMVGRIELVTPQQRSALREIAGLSATEVSAEAGQFITNFTANMGAINRDWSELAAGRKSLADDTPVPKSYRTYLELGRFRNALILDEARRRPTDGLTNFISRYGLEAYRPAASPSGGAAAAP